MISSIKALLKKHQDKVREEGFIDAAMGASALLAYADGELSLTEQMTVEHTLERIEELEVFGDQHPTEVFKARIKGLKSDFDAERGRILEAVGKLKSDADLALIVIRLCVVIGKADLEYSDDEHKVMHEICDAVGVTHEALESLTGVDEP